MSESSQTNRRKPVKHAHLLPRFYLNLFGREAANGKHRQVMQLDQRKDAGKVAQLVSVSNAAVRANFYASTDVTGYEDFESLLSEWESACAEAVRKIAADPFVMGEMQWRQLATFIACQHMRNPAMRWYLGNFQRNFSKMSEVDRGHLARRFSGFTDSLVLEDRDTQARAFQSLIAGTTLMFHGMTVNVLAFETETLLTADVSVFVGDTRKGEEDSGLPEWYLIPMARRVAVLLTARTKEQERRNWHRDQVIAAKAALADKISSAMLRLARPPEPTPGGPAVNWGYAFRHPDDGHLDRLLALENSVLESNARDIPRYARMPGGRRLDIVRRPPVPHRNGV